jgi:ABC-type polysaccharide/polyol phosphate transport system ATPase subunit
MPAIELEGVSKRFVLRKDRPRSFQDLFLHFAGRRPAARSGKPFWAVRDITYTVHRGEAVGVIGENGSGKSTLLKLLAHILEPTEGHIVTHGRVSALLELGAGFHPDLTGRENIYLNGSILGMSRAEIDRRFDEIVAFAELEQFIDMPVKHYSSGMYVRLGFAVATSVQPEILLIDEILAVGDVSFQAKCLDRIRDMRKQGTTIFFVSHDLEAVVKLCDKAVWMDHGRARAVGPTDEVIEKYKGQMTAVQETQLAQRQQAVERDLAQVPACTPAAEPTPSAEGDGPANPRWGTREVEIYAVRLIDGHGAERRIFDTGKPFTVRLYYRASSRIEQPVFGLAVHRSDGLALAGPNTLTSNYPIDAVQGSGYVDYRIDTLPLLEGSYELSVSVYDHALKHAYDHQYRLHSFRVQSKSIHEVLGFVYIPCTWQLGQGAAAPEPSSVGQLVRPAIAKRDA